jgi:phosphoenolpyruvate synthase/pyruvate phosphate dikinase
VGERRLTGELFILQARPETVHATNQQNYIENYKLTGEHGEPLCRGIAVGEKISQVGYTFSIIRINWLSFAKARCSLHRTRILPGNPS